MRRQIQGMPMGMRAAPQIANLACYPVEKAHAYALGPGKSLAICRFIDDLYSAGVPLPPPEAYGMEYKKTAEGESVVYLGVNRRCTTKKKPIPTTSFAIPSSAPQLRRSIWAG